SIHLPLTKYTTRDQHPDSRFPVFSILIIVSDPRPLNLVSGTVCFENIRPRSAGLAKAFAYPFDDPLKQVSDDDQFVVKWSDLLGDSSNSRNTIEFFFGGMFSKRFNCSVPP